LKNKKQPDETTMTLKCRHAAKGDIILEISNLLPVLEFKQQYISDLGEKGEGLNTE